MMEHEEHPESHSETHLETHLERYSESQTGTTEREVERVIPVVEEEISISKREVETGRVQVRTVVRESVETVDEPLYHDSVNVTRVPVGRFVDEVPRVREDGDTTIIPVVEEVLVIEKRLRLKEEIHVRKQRDVIHEPQEVTLRRTEVVVDRSETEDGGR
jgi:stress response protein YsnF